MFLLWLSSDTDAVLQNVGVAVSPASPPLGSRTKPATQRSSTRRCRQSVQSSALHSSREMHSETGIASVGMRALKVLAN